MNRDRFAGLRMQIVGKTKELWGRLTHDSQLERVGNYDYLVGKNRERYGIAKERAERQLREFKNRNRHWDITNE